MKQWYIQKVKECEDKVEHFKKMSKAAAEMADLEQFEAHEAAIAHWAREASNYRGKCD